MSDIYQLYGMYRMKESNITILARLDPYLARLGRLRGSRR